jgi:hypothetical protein
MTRLILAVLVIVASALAIGPSPSGFVYLGHCDPESGWSDDATFEGLPACDGKGGSDRSVIAKKGMKIRDRLPAGDGFGAEVGRIRLGQKVTMVGGAIGVGENVMWGEVVLPR